MLNLLNPAVTHHIRHTESSLKEMARVQAHTESIAPAYRDVYQSTRDTFMAQAADMYWCHCHKLSQLENGTYR